MIFDILSLGLYFVWTFIFAFRMGPEEERRAQRDRERDLFYQCEFCDASYRHASTLKRHTDSTHLGYRFVCRACEQSWIRKENASKHMKLAKQPRCATAGFDRVPVKEEDSKPTSTSNGEREDRRKDRPARREDGKEKREESDREPAKKRLKSVVSNMTSSAEKERRAESNSSATSARHKTGESNISNSRPSATVRGVSKTQKPPTKSASEDTGKKSSTGNRVKDARRPKEPIYSSDRPWKLAKCAVPVDPNPVHNLIPKVYLERGKTYVAQSTMTESCTKDSSTQYDSTSVEYVKSLFLEAVAQLLRIQELHNESVATSQSTAEARSTTVCKAAEAVQGPTSTIPSSEDDVVSLFGGEISDSEEDASSELEDGEIPSSPPAKRPWRP